MVRQASETRRRIVEAAYEQFYSAGFMRAGVDAIAEAAGVTKRTLYYHFESKDDLVAAVLEAQHQLAFERTQRWARQVSGSAGDLVESLFSAFGRWAGTPTWHGSGFTRIAMELADLPGHPARGIAKRHKASVESLLVGKLKEAGVAQPQEAARQVMLLLEGSMALVLIHGDTAYATAAAAAARRLVDFGEVHSARGGMSGIGR
jgi:AcrR family transcriptional regulator